MSDAPRFLFVCCQIGAEAALKAELAGKWPEFRFAYSRPGFVTFKLPPDDNLADDFDLRSAFARCYGFSLGKVVGEDRQRLAREVWQLVGQQPFDRLHVWQRDAALPGDRFFEPGPTPLADDIGRTLLELAPAQLAARAAGPNAPAWRGHRVLDCVLVEPERWWLGRHTARSVPSRWPGGVPHLEKPDGMISRAYLKMEEALAWSRLPIERGERIVELGCAPGGSCQCLLHHGLLVTGIDPAEVDPLLAAHPNFTHLRRRTADVRRKEFRPFRWLTADLNVAPQYTLDAVEAIVTHREANVRGMLLTLKLLDWSLAEHLQEYLARIRSWGYGYVEPRQLAHNRQELCVAALRRRSLRRGRLKRVRTDAHRSSPPGTDH